jgi:hypothetical protein
MFTVGIFCVVHFPTNTVRHASSQSECHLGYCEYCPGEQNLKQMLTVVFRFQATEVVYKQWLATER